MDASSRLAVRPPPPPLGEHPPPLPPPPKRRRKWLVVVGVVLASFAGLLIVGVAMDQTFLTHDLLQEDFEEGLGAFTVSSSATGMEVVDGALVLRTQNGDEPAAVRAPFAREAWAADVSADVTLVTSGPPPTSVDLAVGRTGHAYLFIADRFGFTIARGDAGVRVLAEDRDTPFALAHRIGLRVTKSPTADSVTLIGMVDGREILRVVDEDGIDGFTGMWLIVSSDEPGAQVRFDNVVAEVP